MENVVVGGKQKVTLICCKDYIRMIMDTGEKLNIRS